MKKKVSVSKGNKVVHKKVKTIDKKGNVVGKKGIALDRKGMVVDKNKLVKKQNSLPIKWFVFIVIVAIILSSIISLIVVSYSNKPRSLDAGSVIVQIIPDLEKNSKIVVELVENDEVVSP